MNKRLKTAEMIAKGGPRLIRNEEELQRYTDEMFALESKEDATEAELEAVELLSLLVERYETEHYEMPRASPVEVLRFLMDQHHLSQRDLVPEIGSESLVSRILAGQRNLTVAHMHALAQRFHVPASVFLGRSKELAA